MAMDWDNESDHVRDLFTRAYGSPKASASELATRKPFVVKIDERKIRELNARAAEVAAKLSSSD